MQVVCKTIKAQIDTKLIWYVSQYKHQKNMYIKTTKEMTMKNAHDKTGGSSLIQ